MKPKVLLTGVILGFIGLSYLLKGNKNMTKEEQIEHFGMEVDPKYWGFILGQNPPWDKERIQKAIEVAEKYTSSEKKKVQ